jgi:hypothetical protein
VLLPITLTLQCNSSESAQQLLKHYAEINQLSSTPEHVTSPVAPSGATKVARAPKLQPSGTAMTEQQSPAAADRSEPPSIEQVRARLAAISQAGKTDQVKQLLQRFGADRLTALDPKHFAELMAAAETL